MIPPLETEATLFDSCGITQATSVGKASVEEVPARSVPPLGGDGLALAEPAPCASYPQDRWPDYEAFVSSTKAVVRCFACAEYASRLRNLTRRIVGQAGVGEDQVMCAELVVSELVGNAVAACGDNVALIVEIEPADQGVIIVVHDPAPEKLPCPAEVRLDDPEVESGRGLGLLDLIAPGWRVLPSPHGKQIVCQVKHTTP